MDDVAVLIPCHNEIYTIGAVIEDFAKFLPYATIYVYDNVSTDNTGKKAASYSDEYKVTVRQCPVKGKGNVVRQMFNEIDANVYLMVDGDNTYHACDAMSLIHGISDLHYDMMLGDRLSSTYYDVNTRRFHNIGNRLVNFLVNKLYHGRITDVMTGYRAFSRDFVKSTKLISPGFEIETELCIRALKNKARIGAVPVAYTDRQGDSKSKLNTFSDGFKIIEMIMRLL